MRFIVWALAIATLSSNAQAYDRAKVLQSYFSTVMVRGYNQNGTLAYGTGVVVGEGKVLTNCHTFHTTSKPWVSQGEETYLISGVKVDRAHDLCLLLTDKIPTKPAVLSSSTALKKGQALVSIGHSRGMPAPVNSVGVVKALYPMDDAFVIRTNARFALGASGSGLFDEQGQLVGINTFKTVGKSAYFYAMPVDWLKKLETLEVENQFPITGKAFWETSDGNIPYFMQAAAPELQEDWPKLKEISSLWIKAEPNSSDAWYMLGLAQDGLNQPTEAENAYRKSLALEASNPDALYKIGLIASKKGNKEEVKAVNVALLAIDADVAAEFSKEAGCESQC